jgi:CheY-like chemotaxis protein
VRTRILIVEDDAVLRKHLARLFLREGYAVSTAACRAEATGHLAQAPFDVLLLDLQLPDGNGLDLLANLATDRRPELAVVMSAFCGDDNDLRAQRLNVRRLLRKPLDLVQLLDAVRGVSPTGG